MIGVIADPAEHDVVREFFELFKTPWEFFREDGKYDVVLCAGNHPLSPSARLVVAYAGKRIELDETRQVAIGNQRNIPCILDYENSAFPVYGESTSFVGKENCLLKDVATKECIAFLDDATDQVWARIGIDLFREIRTLLSEGQPAVNAASPTLDLHISFLRKLITEAGVELVEIPPVPDGYRFIACLTHDVDHPSIKAHKWDHTIFGFLYRATIGSFMKLVRGQFSLSDLMENWKAAFKLPFVYLGLAQDFWRDFAGRYLRFEQGLPGTFFVIPFKNRPGKTADGSAPKFRGAGYGAQDIADLIRNLVSTGQEVCLHGIDAWIDSANGRRELQEIRGLTGTTDSGVRMHWLYYDQNSPAVLEKAGASYDSTIGYNQTVGYRAGTTQVYKPLAANQLLELPLHVMDTALFYPAYLNLSRQKAGMLCVKLMDDAVRLGGAFTINWHDRSLAPERLWGASYGDLIQGLKDRGAWFATAGQAVEWFRKRRSAIFEITPSETPNVRLKDASEHVDKLPALRLRVHSKSTPNVDRGQPSSNYTDAIICGGREAAARYSTRP